MADSRHFEKPLNCHNLATFHPTAMKFGIMMHFNPVKPSHH